MKNLLIAPLVALALSFGVCSSSFANSPVALWTDPINPYSPGTRNGVPFWMYQKWGVVITVPNDETFIDSATLGLQLRDYVYVPGDASPSLQLNLYAWSPTLMQSQGPAIFESAPLYRADLWGDVDPWGDRKGTIELDTPVIAGSQYLAQFIGTGFVLFETGVSNSQLVLDQDGRGWSNFPISVASEFKFGNASLVPEPATYALMLAGLGVMGGIARHRKAPQSTA